MLKISEHLAVPWPEIEWTAIRAQGSGGQNVNKVSSAVHLRFDIRASSLPPVYKERLLAFKDRRISDTGIIVIKAQQFRSREKNREDACSRLQQLIRDVAVVRRERQATRPTRGSANKRMDGKSKRGQLKRLRSRVEL